MKDNKLLATLILSTLSAVSFGIEKAAADDKTFDETTTNNEVITADTVTINESVTLTNQAKITASSGITNNGTLNSSADYIDAQITQVEAGIYNVAGGAIAKAITGGTVNFTADTTVNNASYINAVNTLDISTYSMTVKDGIISKAITGTGSVIIDGSVSLSRAIENAVTINSGKTLTVANAVNLSGSTAVSLSNDESTLQIGGALSRQVTGTGKLWVYETASNLAANSGVGTLQVDNTKTFTNTGTLTVANTLTNNGTISNTGTLTLSGTNMENAGTIQGDSGTLIVSGTLTNNSNKSITQNNLTISSSENKLTNNGTVTVKGTLSNSGEIENNSTLNLNSTGSIANAGTISGTNGTLNVAGTLTTTGHSITQNKLEVTSSSGGVVANITDLTLGTDGLVNAGSQTVLKGGASSRQSNTITITGSGTTEFQGMIENNADITQGTLKITGNVLNTTGKAIDAAITNTGTLEANANDIKKAVTNAVDTNNGTYNITGGAIGAAISGGTVNISGTTASIADISMLMSAGTITNKGTLTITGANGSITNAINNLDANNVGTTVLNGTNTSVGAAIYNLVTIGGSVTTANADNFKNTVKNNGTLTVSATSDLNKNIIKDDNTTGNAQLTISDGTLTNKAAITQKTVELSSNSAKLTNTDTNAQINADVTNAGEITSTVNKISGTITNSKLITLQGGTASALEQSNTIKRGASNDNSKTVLENKINNTNAITQKEVEISSGAQVTNTAAASQINAVTITNNGSLTSSANKITGAITNNSGSSLTLQGGAFADTSSIAGAGNVVLEDVTLKAGGLSGVTGGISVSEGKYALMSDTLSNNITGAGTVKVNTALTVDNGKSISNLDVNAGTLTLSNAATVTNLNINGGTIDMQQGTGINPLYSALTVTTLSGSGSLKADVNMDDLSNNSYDRLSVTNLSGSPVINIIDLNIRANKDSNGVDYISFVQGANSGISYTFDGAASKVYTATVVDDNSTFKYTFTDNNDGRVKVESYQTQTKLNNFLSSGTDSISLNKDVHVDTGSAAGTMNGNSTNLTLNVNNGVSVIGGGSTGITVTANHTLKINGEQTSIPENPGAASTMKGFTKALINNGTLEVSNMKFTDNTTSDIENAENKTLTLKGTNSFTKGISGTGTTVIASGKTTLASTASLNQTRVNITAADAELEADPDSILAEIANGGVINLSADGTGNERITKNITQYNDTLTGTLNIKSNISVGASTDTAATQVQVNQGTINIGDTTHRSYVVTNYGHIEANTFNNYGTLHNYSNNTLVVNGGINNGTIDDTSEYKGHIEVGSDNTEAYTFTNAGTITQSWLDVSTNSTLINNADHNITVTFQLGNKGTIKNDGNLYLTGTDNTKMINTGSIVNSTGLTSGTTYIYGKVNSSSGSIEQAVIIGDVDKTTPVGELTIKAGNIKAAITNNVANGLVLIEGANTNESTLSYNVTGGGSVKVAGKTSTSTIYNNSAISQAVNVVSGIFNNNGASGYVTGNLTISSGATAKNSSTKTSGVSGATTLANVINNGIFELSNGKVTSITNKASETQGVTQTGGEVATVTNGDSTAAGKYTISKGQITTSITNNNTNSALAISGDTTGANITQIALVTNTLGSVTQSGGVVTTVDNDSSYTQSGGNVGTATNSKSYTISGGSITTSITNDNANSSLTVSGGSVVLLNNNVGQTTQSNGSITTVNNGVTNGTSGTYSISGGTAGTVHNNNGTVTQSGGTVTTANNAAIYNIKSGINVNGTSNTTAFSQTASSGVLNIYGNSSINVKSGSSITNGTITLGDTSNNTGSITFSNGLNTNAAQVTTKGNGGSSFIVSSGSEFTTLSGTSIGDAIAVNVAGTLNHKAGTVKLNNNDTWTGTVNVSKTDETVFGTLELSGVTQGTNAALKMNTTDDTKSVINVTANQILNAITRITNGNLYLKNSGTQLTLKGASDTEQAILRAGTGNAYVNIAEGTTLNIGQYADVTLNGGDNFTTETTRVKWDGTVNLNGGKLTLENIKDASRVGTSEASNKTGILNAQTGTLNINASNVLLGNNDIIADAVALSIYANITVASGATVEMSSADTWSAGYITQTGGTLTLDNITTEGTKYINSNGGTLNIKNATTPASKLTLASVNDTISANTVVNLIEGNTLDIQNTATAGVTLDNGSTSPVSAADDWSGKITQSGGALTLSGRNDTTTNDKTYNMTNANALLKLDNAILNLKAGSKTVNGEIDINTGSTLKYDNGAADNSAKIISDTNTNNKLYVGDDNTTTLTLKTSSDIKSQTAITVNAKGTLNSYGTMIKGAVTNNGIYNLENEGTTAGTIAGAITGTGTLNLKGTTESTAAGTINQKTINVTNGTFTAGASVTATELLKITNSTDSIVNGIVNNAIVAEVLNNEGTIKGATSGTATTYGNLKVNNGGYSKGAIDQGIIEFVTGSFDNDADLTAHTELKVDTTAALDNSGSGITVTAQTLTNNGVIQGTGDLVVKNGGSSQAVGTAIASITQANITLEAGTFNNYADMTANTKLTNDTNSTLHNYNNATITVASAENNGIITNDAGAAISGKTTDSVLTNNNIITNEGTISAVIKNTNGATVTNRLNGTLAKVSTNEAGGTIISTASGLTDTVTNDGDVYLNNGLTGTQGDLVIQINSTNGTNEGNLYIVDDVNVKQSGLKTGSIIQNYIAVQNSATLKNMNHGSIEAASMRVLGGTLELEEGSYTYVPDIKIIGGTLSLVDDADLRDGSNVLITNGNLKLTAQTKNVEFRAPVDDNSTYSITAQSAEGLKVTIDSDISKATSIITEANSTLDIDAVTIGSLGNKSVTMKNNSTLGLNAHNTHYGTYEDVTFVSNVQGNNYTLNINNDNANAKVTLNTEIRGAKEINVKNGTLEINDNTILNSTPVNLKTDAPNYYDGDMNIVAANTINLTSNITGDDNLKNNLYITDAAGSTTNGIVNVMSKIDNVALHVNSGEMYLPSASNITDRTTVQVAEGAVLNVINNTVETYGSNYTLEDGAVIKIDAHMTDFKADNFKKAVKNGKVIIDEVNPLNAEWIVHDNAIINLKADLGIDNFEYSDKAKNQYFNVLTPIRRLQGFLDTQDDRLVFVKTGDEYENFNPAVFNSVIAAQIGGYLTQLDTYNEAFGNMDMYAMMTQEERQAAKFANKYAAADSNLIYSPLSNPNLEKSAWFRPYTTFEHVKMKRGPKVRNNAYGTFAGLESGLYDLGRGWDANFGIYAGYNGSHQSYQGNSIYQNGATLGVIGSAFKNDFFVGATINVSDNIAEADNMYGKEDFNMLMSGAALKGGYNWELAKGKFIIQPSFQTSYSFVRTFNYTNSAKVRINSDPLNAIQLEPQLKLIGNFKHGWQPYAHLSGVWTMMDKSKYMANDVSLPELAIKPFAKYGFGLRKTFGDRASGFFQTFFTSGGRNGMGLQFGFRIQLGESKKQQKIKSEKEGQISEAKHKKYITK